MWRHFSRTARDSRKQTCCECALNLSVVWWLHGKPDDNSVIAGYSVVELRTPYSNVLSCIFSPCFHQFKIRKGVSSTCHVSEAILGRIFLETLHIWSSKIVCVTLTVSKGTKSEEILQHVRQNRTLSSTSIAPHCDRKCSDHKASLPLSSTHHNSIDADDTASQFQSTVLSVERDCCKDVGT